MDAKENLVLLKGQDKTQDVTNVCYKPGIQKFMVTFKGGKSYNYNPGFVEHIKNPDELDPALIKLWHNDKELCNIQSIFVFRSARGDYLHVCFERGGSTTYKKDELKLAVSCLCEDAAKNCLTYLKQLAAASELKGEDDINLLKKQYEKLEFVDVGTALAVYLSPHTYKLKTLNTDNLIFPFGGNKSQFKAVTTALTNQISVIQGPPGTGKTQTILNIIANLLVKKQTVLVVSNNNSATANVLEKLASKKYGMGFLAAPLGNTTNKKKFIENQTGQYPPLADWQIEPQNQEKLQVAMKALAIALMETFDKQEQLAKARAEKEALDTEIKYFRQYIGESGVEEAAVTPKRKLKSAKLMRLWQECNAFAEKEKQLSFWFKLKSVFFYGISDWAFYSSSMSVLVTLFQKLYYQARQQELNTEIAALEKYLVSADAENKMEKLTSHSLRYLRGKLFERYGEEETRPVFSEEDLRMKPDDIVKEYPVVLSTTFSSVSSLRNVVYDYLIMDEASQVDIATGALALSCARNAVIVGDLKQLPNVVTNEMKARCNDIFAVSHLPEGYSFSENSFLKSICSVVPAVPQTLLREHYRCHPKIIEFCNQKFYNGELVIMTQDHEERDTLTVLQTRQGNHHRGHVNQRQVDVTIKEALPMLAQADPAEIGIIAPYRAQVAAISSQLAGTSIEVDTVHKFQGREKDTMVLTTVDDVVTDFSDDPYLLNVAISRAKKRLILVAPGNEQPADSNIRDLIEYIKYNNYQVIESELYSVFDLLYQQYTSQRIAYLKKHARVSQYDSENLMYGAITDLLKQRAQLSLRIICHQPLNMLIRDPKRLDERECQYAMNAATHLDFLIYNYISKRPVLAVEVDGFHFHKPGTAQYERDRMKDHILQLYSIPLLRFATNGSGEIEELNRFLDEYERY